MTSNTTTARAGEAEYLLFDSWFDPIEDGLRAKVRGFIETMIEGNSPLPCRARATGGGRLGRRATRRRLLSWATGMADARAG